MEDADRPAGRGSLRSARTSWPARLRRLISIDERSLAVFRIGLSLVLLADLGSRARHLAAHYSDAGSIPRSLLDATSSPSIDIFFLYGLHGSTTWATLLFALTAVAGLTLLIGYRTSWAAAACYVLVSCLHARAPSLTHAGDDLLRIFLIWAALLPLGTGVTGTGRRNSARSSPRLGSVATAAVRIQITAFLWLVPHSITDNPGRLFSSTAFSDALRLEALITPWGSRLREWPNLAGFADLAGGALILVAPLLLWSPFLTGPLRSLAVVSLVQFELLVVAPAFGLGIQPWVAALAWTLFLPSWFWDQFTESARSGRSRRPSTARQTIVGLFAVGVLAAGFVPAQPGAAGTERKGSEALSLPGQLGLSVPRAFLLPATTHLTDGWLVARGTTTSGAVVDPWRMTEATFDRPSDIAGLFDGIRWREHLMATAFAARPEARLALIDYLCRRWKRIRPASPLARIELVFMLDHDFPRDPSSSALPVAVAAGQCQPAAADPAGREPPR